MRVFVTGGSGFVGGHVIEKLVAAGHEVGAMARSEGSAEIVRGFGAEPVPCSLGEVGSDALSTFEAVVHCAAYVEEWGTRAQFWDANVLGTSQLLEVAQAAGVRRFIFIGTEAAVFDGHNLIAIDETAPYPERQRFLYSETKAEAERRVLAANDENFTTISLRPRLVWGPRDQSILPAILRMVDAGNWSWLDRGEARTSTTHVYNLVHAVELALHQGRGGEAYFIADDGETDFRTFLTALTATVGVVLPERSMPSWLARTAAAAVETVWRVCRIRRTPPLTRFATAMMSSSVTVRTEKAQRELGYGPVISVDEALASSK
ncbi:NAD-dependent epimerase/dehydratase family protein [Haliangium ochraceum]|uniref:NAD-dependent epimerase/dehydratase n=1 Tax=Haliangium ochraceum (strain DSM 14365 / JCM 11303 / SMP-2) TaxID=502025 RepID=D0LWY4_HALO1|nr:NAD-dependent epimerase/dehydratase family protein [Haliangium ochraceum]ACY14231.1 NAD-dependent epimerase/dehydratase [Haliangium ochraceum DSM 14365]